MYLLFYFILYIHTLSCWLADYYFLRDLRTEFENTFWAEVFIFNFTFRITYLHLEKIISFSESWATRSVHIKVKGIRVILKIVKQKDTWRDFSRSSLQLGCLKTADMPSTRVKTSWKGHVKDWLYHNHIVQRSTKFSWHNYVEKQAFHMVQNVSSKYNTI